VRILTVSNLYPPNAVGGYEVLCAQVTEGLAARGHDISVLTSCFGGRPADGRPVTVHQALQLVLGDTVYKPFEGSQIRREAINRANIAAFLRCLDRARPDVVFCWNLYGLDGGFFDRLNAEAVPLVVMLTDNWLAAALQPDFVSEYFVHGVFPPAGRHAVPPPVGTRRLLRAGAIFGARFMRDFYASAGIGFQSDRVIHNGVRLAPAAGPLRDRAMIGHSGTVALLFAGRVVEIKGAHVALEALARLQAERPGGLDFTLTFVGDDSDADYRMRLSAIARETGCAERVRFAPAVAEDRLFGLFQDYDIYVFPSLYEPFSLTLIHALAAGIPTVASRVGGNTEIVEEGETGLLAERNDPVSLAGAITRLCIDAALRRHVAARGRETAARFTFDHMLAGMEDYLMTVTG
jgi:glycogen(starch) synthase